MPCDVTMAADDTAHAEPAAREPHQMRQHAPLVAPAALLRVDELEVRAQRRVRLAARAVRARVRAQRFGRSSPHTNRIHSGDAFIARREHERRAAEVGDIAASAPCAMSTRASRACSAQNAPSSGTAPISYSRRIL